VTPTRNAPLAPSLTYLFHFTALGCALTLGAPTVVGEDVAPPSDVHDERRDAMMEQAIILAQATEDAEKPSQIDQSVKESPAPPPLSPEEIVQAIKLRAQRELARRRARKWSLNTNMTWTVANESNPQLIKSRSSALYTEEYLSTTFSYKITPGLTWQAGYSLDALNYNEYTDGSTLTNSLTTKLIYRLTKPLRLEAHYTYDDSDYPYDDGASTWDQKAHLRLHHSFLKRYYHYAGWTYLYKQYKDKLTRDGAGTRIPTKYRKDQRHTGIYEMGGRLGEGTTLKLKQEFYFNDSNDAFQDYYDAQDYKAKLSGSHAWTERWSSSGGFTYELKRYERRNVTARGVAEQDYTKTYEVGTTYKLSPRVDLTYTWKYKKQDSNDPGQSYQDITNSLALTALF
jgi:hypothetical protein